MKNASKVGFFPSLISHPKLILSSTDVFPKPVSWSW